ncbi:hypothetical protein DL771_009904 [Monosporascus sp. 5C6A]|nr:hypothetical protein DL771_009904 [Monosporascus sp. 5C6A]
MRPSGSATVTEHLWAILEHLTLGELWSPGPAKAAATAAQFRREIVSAAGTKETRDADYAVISPVSVHAFL